MGAGKSVKCLSPFDVYHLTKISDFLKREQRYEELKRFQLENGHADPPIDYPKLGIWCLNQRFNLENMPQYRIDKLDELGFTWNYNTRSSNDEVWNEKYELLQEYIRENGHPNVPKSNEPLSCWVRKQVSAYFDEPLNSSIFS